MALVAFAILGCAGEPGVKKAKKGKAAGKPKKTLALHPSQGEAALMDRYAMKKADMERDEKGMFKAAKRSQFDGQKALAFGGGVGTASYRKKTFNTQGWSGNTTARTKSYGENTDGSRFQTASRFQGASAAQDGSRSRFDGSKARTSKYETGRAPEAGSKRLDKPTDSLTDFKRRVYPEPQIMTEAEYRALTVDQTRSILGRDD